MVVDDMNNSLCVLPWMHLASHPNGGASLCCRSNHTNAVSWAKSDNGELRTFDNSTLPEIINSQSFIRIRQEMMDGKQPVECEGCWRDEAAGLESKRQYENKRWEHVVSQLEQTAVLKTPNYRYVELRLGNVCNSACVTCNSFSSSKWYKDEEALAKKLPWFVLRPLENFKWFENEKFYEELADLSPNVEEIYINGGEPTLIKAHFKYLERLIANGQAQKVHLVYSLNMINIPEQFINLIKQFKRVTINCSIDDYGDRNYYIRWPSKWEDTVHSLQKLSALPDNIEWSVCQTVSIFNAAHLYKLDTWLFEKYGKMVTYNFVLYPNYLSLAALPDDYKHEIKERYSSHITITASKRDEFFTKLDMPHDLALTVKAKEFITSLDDSRGISYKDYIPELQRIL